MSKDPKQSKVYCLEGTIRYSVVDGNGRDNKSLDGKLIYIKPVLIGGEPPDEFVLLPAHPQFPHETTANQFFNEANLKATGS